MTAARTRRGRSVAARATVAALAVLLCAIPAGAATNDDYSARLWGLRKVGAEQAWQKGMGAGVTIAVVDSGVDMTHEDLEANVVGGRDFVASDNNPRDEHGHGTHVAGIAAAVANNGIGVAGVAPKARIMPIRVLDADGEGYLSDVEAGIRYAADRGAKVINLSLGAEIALLEALPGNTLTDAVNYAWDRGAIAVVAAGNDSLFRAELGQARALIVTATTPSDEKAPYATSVGPLARWALAAPGGTDVGGGENMIISTYWSKDGQRYAYGMGTSMAAPHVSGAAAVLLGLGLRPQEVVDRLLGTAKDLGPRGRDSTFGSGRLDLAAAVAGLKAAPSTGASGSTSGASTAPPRGTDAPDAPSVRRTSAPQATGSRPAAPGEPDAPESDPTAAVGIGASAPPRSEDDGETADDQASPPERRSALPNVLVGLAAVTLAAGALAYPWLRGRFRPPPP